VYWNGATVPAPTIRFFQRLIKRHQIHIIKKYVSRVVRLRVRVKVSVWEDYCIGPPRKVHPYLFPFHTKGLGLGLGWRSNSVVYGRAYAKRREGGVGKWNR